MTTPTRSRASEETDVIGAEEQAPDLDRRAAQPTDPDPIDEDGSGRQGSSRPPSATAELEAIAAELEATRSQLRDYEKALVERIADVDDDRRATATRLQRAWQTRREEIDRRLQRQGRVSAATLALFAVVLAASLVLLHREMDASRQPLADDLAEVKEELARASSITKGDALMEQKLVQLATAVGGISSSLEQMSTGPGPDLEAALSRERAARDEAVARILSELRRLKNDQAALTADLQALRAWTPDGERRASSPPPAPPAETTQPIAAAEVAAAAAATQGRASEEQVRQGPSSPAAGPADTGASEVTPITPVTAPSADGERGSAERATAQGAPPATPTARDPGKPREPSVGPQGSEKPAGDRPAEHAGAANRTGDDSNAGIDEASALREVIVIGDSQYAIQLLGVYDLQSLLDYVKRADLPPRVYYREETLKGRPWYVLIESLHDSYAAASDERSRLPPELVKLDIWIRRLPEGTELQVLDTKSPR